MNSTNDSIIMTKCPYCGNDAKSTKIFETLTGFCHYCQNLFSIRKYQDDMQTQQYALQMKKLDNELAKQKEKNKDLKDMFYKELLEKDLGNLSPKRPQSKITCTNQEDEGYEAV
jgi:recombinational DNA repair protein (RecF pathway)